MFRKLFLAIISPSVMLLLFTSCELYDWSEWYDSHQHEGGVIYCISEGEKYEVDLRNFTLCTSNLVYNDTITLDDAVQTANNGFIIERGKLVNMRNAGNYEIRRFRYKASFIVYITPFARSTYQHYLPFEFEAEELWLNGEALTKQPFVFEKGTTDISEEILPEDSGFYASYLLKFPIKVYYRYSGQQIAEFEYIYQLMRNNNSVVQVVPSSEVIIQVTYNYQP